MTDRKPSLAGRIGRWAAALVGAGLASTAPVAAQSVSPSAAPAEWVAYAEATTARVTGWLQADGEPAARLRAYLDASRPAPDQPTAPLVLKIWVDGEGTVSRIDYPPFAHNAANADLRAIIVGQRLSSAPPKNMVLPLRIGIQLEPAPQPAQEVSPVDGTRRIVRSSVDRT